MKIKSFFYTAIFIFIISFSLPAQQKTNDTLFVAFWNLQNLFDTIDDPDKRDEDFLPTGEMEYTPERMNKQLYNLSRVIRSMNDNSGPHILGVCEVEHKHLLDSLSTKFLSDKNYKIAYAESPDNRGIDNGLIYDDDLFDLISIHSDTVVLPDRYPTRLILNVNLLNDNNDTLKIFVNHWPSRRGGEVESEPNRVAAAETLRKTVTKYFNQNKNSQIIIMGDFNDEPINKSILTTLNANPFYCDKPVFGDEIPIEKQLFNLAYKEYEEGTGSYKYRDDWNMLDQIIVSGSLIIDDDIKYICNSFEVYKPEFMITRSGKYKGTPFPTYGGRRYLGGYSDHFPVIAKFIVKGE